MAALFRGWILVGDGQIGDGIRLMRRGLDSFWARGLGIEAPYFLALLGEAHRAAGEKADGLRCVSEGLARAQRTGERWSEAELHRVQADLLIDENLEGGWRPLPPCHRWSPADSVQDHGN